MILVESDKEVTIQEQYWPLAEDLFIKWGYFPEGNQIKVNNINDITSELSVWGIPFTRTKWNY